MGCEYKARCLPQNGSVPEAAACASVTDGAACSARDECVFVRPSGVPTLCLRAVMQIGSSGVRYVLNNPESACAYVRSSCHQRESLRQPGIAVQAGMHYCTHLLTHTCCLCLLRMQQSIDWQANGVKTVCGGACMPGGATLR